MNSLIKVSKEFCFFAASGYLGPLLFLILFSAHHLGAQNIPLKRFEFSSLHMGTVFQIILYDKDSVHATTAARKAFERMKELDDIMSDYKIDSELNRLSSTSGSGKSIEVSDDLWTVLCQAAVISRKTNGAFDITVGPLSRLWRRSFRQYVLPEPDRIEEAKKAVNYEYVQLYKKDRKVKLEKIGMRLDLGGIAKGYAADEAKKVLYDNQIPIVLVDAGGDIVLGDPPPNRNGWEIEILGNAGANEYPHHLVLSNVAIATSGDLYRFIEIDGKRYSHIIDPRTGYGVEGQNSVTIITKNGILADALASAVIVMGPEKGLKKIKCFGKPAVLFVRKEETRQNFHLNRRMRSLLR